MTETILSTIPERKILLSLADKDYSGKAVNYTPASINVGSLESILKKHNYSPISWYSNYRASANFRSASGFCVDSDYGMTMSEALEKLRQLGWNYFLVTTRSHQQQGNGDRFRIFIPFNRTIYSYKVYRAIIDAICVYFPQSDPKTFDGARQLYASPDTAKYHSHWDGADFDVSPFLKDGEWDASIRLLDEQKKTITIQWITGKVSIYCPFHTDNSPSAFIDFSKDSSNHFIYCSSCGKTFWRIKEPLTMEERCKEFYSLGTGFHQLSITRSQFSMIEIGEKKIYSLAGATEKEEQKKMFDWLMQNHHFPDMTLVEQIGDLNATGSYFEPLIVEGMVRVHHGAIPVIDRNNSLIEEFLNASFKEMTKTFKQWMAVYAHDNYKRLPFIILTGERGAGKNTFAELIGAIYKPLSMSWSGKSGQFTPENEMKLVIADETASDDINQYLQLKRLSGQQYLPVNKKHKQQYEVRNNINVIILSNTQYPIQLERSELPTSDRDNQFLVYKMKKNYQTPDAEYGEKLRRALGHYIRTELKTVYDEMDLSSYRYSISVPITEYEKEMFGASVTPEEDVMDRILLKLKDAYDGNPAGYTEFLKKGYVPTELLDDSIEVQRMGKHKIVKRLRAHGYLTADNIDRPAMKKVRPYCYKGAEKLMTYLEE